MADFKNIIDFQKGKLAQSPYQDPTYLSFVILFDMHSHTDSPLLSGAAAEWYATQLAVAPRTEKTATKMQGATGTETPPAGAATNPRALFYQDRLEALIKFKTANLWFLPLELIGFGHMNIVFIFSR